MPDFTLADLERLETLAKTATPGPWQWFGNTASKTVYLATKHSGRRYVMDFVRWGAQHAQPRFQTDRRMVKLPEFVKPDVEYRQDFTGINHPDAEYIATLSPDVVLGLLAAVRERDALKAELARAKAETLETAAKVADNKLEWARGFFEPDKNNLYNVIAITAAEVAQEIRALAQQPAPEGEHDAS